MALVVQYQCTECGNHTSRAIGSGKPRPDKCFECEAKDKDIARREYFGSLDALTIEERLRKVEKWIYEYRPYAEPRF